MTLKTKFGSVLLVDFISLFPDSETFINYPIKGGVTARSVQAIIEDDQENIWVSTSNGLKRFEKKSQTFRDYRSNQMDLVNKVFVNGSKFKDKNGTLYFGSWDKKRNVVSVNPKAASLDENAPQLIFADFKIFNKPLEIGGENSPVTKDIFQKRNQ